MLAQRPDNVIALVPYRMARLAQRQAPRPYLLWYPNVGFVTSRPTTTPPMRPQYTARAAEPI